MTYKWWLDGDKGGSLAKGQENSPSSREVNFIEGSIPEEDIKILNVNASNRTYRCIIYSRR